MSQPDQSTVQNLLLQTMSADDFALLAPILQPCKAPRGTVLFEEGALVETAWFLESGVGSIVTTSPGGLRAENGLFGRDGFAPVGIIMGNDRAPHMGVIQISDECWNVSAALLIEATNKSASLQTLLLRYAQTLAIQANYTALSNAVHPIDKRLARWILMCDDRMDTELALTHEFLSIMLAVRRPSVTTALHVLEGNGIIRSERGCIFVRNRAGLERFAGDSYGAPEREYERLIGPLR